MRVSLALGGLGFSGHFSRLGRLSAFTTSPGDYRALVCIFLFGGNDSNNMVIPMDTKSFDAYTNVRKNLALPAANLLPVETKAKAPFGLHPQLKGAQSLFGSGQLAVVANVGTLVQPLTRDQYLAQKAAVPSNLFSHSDQQTQWQTSEPNSFATSGWGGRVADQVAYLNAASTFPTLVSVAGNNMFCNGEQTRPGSVVPNATLGLKGINSSQASQRRFGALQELLTLNSGATLIQQAAATMAQGLKDSATLSRAMTGATPLETVFPTGAIGAQLQQVAKLIQVSGDLGMNRQIFFCSLGGFDTHTNQLNDQDRLLGQLDQAMAAFYNATVELGVQDKVVTFTESDFTRTFQPNSNGGTDHAWGGHHLVVGGAIKGGDIYGTFPNIALGGPDDAGNEGRWIPTTSIDQYGATLATWFGVPADKLPAVFPNIQKFGTQNLGFAA
jgi:uncharacterized protein (DUF1501 family)